MTIIITADEVLELIRQLPPEEYQKVIAATLSETSQIKFIREETGSIKLVNQEAFDAHNMQIYERQQEAAILLKSLNEAARVITRTLDLDEILAAIVEQACRLMGTSDQEVIYSHLTLVQGEKLVITSAYPPEYLPALRENFEVNLNSSDLIGIMGRSVITGQQQLVADVMTDIDYIPIHPEIRSELAVPIHVDEQVIGVINVEHPQTNAFNNDDMQALQTLAEYAAIAINNAKMYQELKEVKGLVGARTALAWMGMTSNAWRHSIEGDAINIRSITSLLRSQLQTIVPDQTSLQKIDERLSLMERLANQILSRPITAPLSSVEGVENINIHDLITDRIQQLWSGEPFKMIERPYFHFANGDISVWASQDWIRLALDLLVDNAAQAMVTSQVRRIYITTNVIENMVNISIRDTGKGIDKDILSNLFNVPLEQAESGGHLGRGLLMVQAIVQTYGGQVYVSETGSKGTTMVFTLPVARGEVEPTNNFFPTKVEIPKSLELSRFYNELVRAYEELLELDRRKTEFLSTVSHELRTPLMPIQSCIEFMLSGMYGSITNKQRERLEIALKNVHDEVRLIDNLLDLVRIQEGRTNLRSKKINIIQLATDVINVFEYDAQKRNINLHFEVDNLNGIEYLTVDEGKIKRVIINLVSNAFKFTLDDGTIVISISQKDNEIRFFVSDTGIGIDEKEFEKIFSRFYQVDSSLTRSTNGTGIGLNICREYVELHGGRIWVQTSEIGKGSTFVFTLPIAFGEQ